MPIQLNSIPLMTGVAFGTTYLGLALGRFPGTRMDRAGIALAGAAAMPAIGAVDFREAAAAIDLGTIALLLGMMIVSAHLRMSGFFAAVTARIAGSAIGPFGLLAVIVGLSGLLSAFLVNDVVCVAMTPLVLDLCRRLGRAPLPYLIALATASNIGSSATITGNPQNMIIGVISTIPYARFCARLAPPALLGLVADYLIICLIYRESLRAPALEIDSRTPAPRRSSPHRRLTIKTVAVILITVGMFFAALRIATAALIAATALLIDRIRPEKIYRTVDWPLLVMFAGLFVVVRAFELRVVKNWGIDEWSAIRESPVVLLSGLSLALSNLVSNVPAVLLFRPIVTAIPEQETAWLALAMSSTFAGNLTLLGSVANLIVVESARREGVHVSFVEYLKVGAPITIITTAVGIAWLVFF